jgi:hypothetical protein
MARAKTRLKKEPLIIRTIALARDTDATLARLSMDASDYVGRTVSGSAIVRALLRYAEQQRLASHLFSLVEQELESGIFWGKKR